MLLQVPPVSCSSTEHYKMLEYQRAPACYTLCIPGEQPRLEVNSTMPSGSLHCSARDHSQKPSTTKYYYPSLRARVSVRALIPKHCGSSARGLDHVCKPCVAAQHMTDRMSTMLSDYAMTIPSLNFKPKSHRRSWPLQPSSVWTTNPNHRTTPRSTASKP